MELYNKGARGFIIKREDAISGCRLPADEIGKTRAYIDPGKTVEVEDACGADLVRKYPNELLKMGSATRQEKLEEAHKLIEEEKKNPKAKPRAKAKAKPKAKPVAKKKAAKKRA